MGQTYIHEGLANTLAARDYKQPQTIVLIGDGHMNEDYGKTKDNNIIREKIL